MIFNATWLHLRGNYELQQDVGTLGAIVPPQDVVFELFRKCDGPFPRSGAVVANLKEPSEQQIEIVLKLYLATPYQNSEILIVKAANVCIKRRERATIAGPAYVTNSRFRGYDLFYFPFPGDVLQQNCATALR